MTQEEVNHRQEASKKLSVEGRKFFDFIEFDQDEELVTEIRKHPFGLFLIYFIGGFVLLTLLFFLIFVANFNLGELGLGDTNTSNLRAIAILIGLLLMVGGIAMTFISAFLYKSNVIYVTNEKIAQVLYVSLFHRKISQLSIGDVQDVTVRQSGIFAHLFKFGTLTIETAGEQQNYTFTYIPEPYQNSKLIVGAHEKNLVLHGN